MLKFTEKVSLYSKPTPVSELKIKYCRCLACILKMKTYFLYAGDFLEETKEARWDQLRVVVTQPFNLQTQFGLSFLRVFSCMEEETADTKISPDSFAEWKKMKYQINNPMR